MERKINMKLKSIAANQTEISISGNTVFFSYETPVAFINKTSGKSEEFYSQTTTKHINAFFRRHNIDPKNVKLVPQDKIDQLLK